ncbi:MAG TPA: response regulator transcription factor [Chloroflexota bacterium]|nr:response regulator transcription factor [Chloroflexota bacterium]
MGRRILVADADPDVREQLRLSLEHEGYSVLQAADGAQAVATVQAEVLDLVVLGVLLPVLDGFTVLRSLRAFSTVPLILLTAQDDEDAQVQALRLGADGYLSKPYNSRELLARIASVLRRAAPSTSLRPDVLMVDEDLTIDFARNRVVLRGREQALTATEHRLLYHLVRNAGRLLPFAALLARVWGSDYREEVHYVRLYVSYLRAKIEPDPGHPRYILTEKGLGYRFVDLSSAAL